MENTEKEMSVNPTKKKSGFSTAALVLGIIGIVLSFIPIIRYASYPLGVLAFIFGIIPLLGKKSVAKSIVAVILAIAALVLTYKMQTATINAVSEALSEASDSIDDITGDNTDKILKENLDVKIGEFKIVSGDFTDDTKLPITLKNKGKSKSSFSVKIEAVNKSGERLEDDTVTVDNLNAGQSQTVEAFNLITSDTAEKIKNAQFKIVEVSMY